MDKVLSNTNPKGAENRLRKRIEQVLASAGLNQPKIPLAEITDQIIQLFRDYAMASETKKDEVYERGVQKILQNIENSSG